MNVVQQFISQLGQMLPASVHASSSPLDMGAMRAMPMAGSVLTPLLPGHMLMPSTPWDWPEAITGTATDAQFRFADAVPQSTGNGELYLPSSRSFAQGYRAFLEFIPSARFPSPDLLASARRSAALPAGNPVIDPTPAGWTKVTTAGYAQWQPIWDIPISAAAWMVAVAAGSINNPGTLRLALNTQTSPGEPIPPHLSAQDTSGADLALPPTQFDTVDITAACWGNIPIYPGSWFDASMLMLGKSFVPDPSVFFGPGGLMACRVSSFYVALNPKFDFTSSGPITASLPIALAKADAILAMGVPVKMSQAMLPNDAKLSFSGIGSSPVIVAVVLDVLA
jgi:hypothetical protein